jgi:phage terminase large subunit-like protein
MGDKEKVRKRKRLEKMAGKLGVKCFNSFYFFFKTFWPEMSGENYVDNWHVKYICDVLDENGMKIVRGDVLRKVVIINVPPGSSKSTIATVAFPLWLWLHKPSCTTVNISFSAELSKDHQELSKAIPGSNRWSQLFDKLLLMKHGKKIEVTTSNKIKVQNNFGGKRFNTSVGGSITGRHADVIIEDDPLDPERAFSDAERRTAIRFHDKTISTRKKNDNCYLNIIIAQRLHEEDVCGHVLKKNQDITHICLPGEITNSTFVHPPEAAKYYVDGILNPIRKGRNVLDDLKESMGGDAYTTQVLQLPFDIENQDITPGMFKKIHEKEIPTGIIWDVWVDGAFTDKTENDPTGIDIIARVGNGIIIKNSYNVRKKLPDLVKFIIELEQEGIFSKKDSRIFIEPKASGYPLAQYIESDTEYNFVLIGENNKEEKKLVSEGKKSRHEMIKPKAASGRITLVEGNWNEDLIHQVCGFPRAAHDEQVDNIGYAINHYFTESTFIKEYALNRLEKKLTGAINIILTSQIQRNKIAVSYEENDSGDVQLFDDPNRLYKYRYICVLVLKSEGDRGGNTSIVVLDRMMLTVSSMFVSDSINPKKAGLKALEMAQMYDTAKLVVAVQKDRGQTQNEEYDLGHIAIQEARKVSYNNIYFRTTQNRIKKAREREYGFEVNPSTSREVYYNMKDMLETAKVKELPLDVFEEVKMLERKKETGEISAKEGYQTNTALAYALALKINEEMYDKPKIKKSEKW